MAKKAKQDKTNAEKWLERISRAKQVKEEWKKNFRIALAYEYWEGRQRPPHIPADQWITVNLIYSCLMAELPTLYSTDPFFYVKCKKSYSPDPAMIEAFDMKGKIRAAMLNYLKGELNLKPKARLSIFDAFFQYGICKIHYSADFVDNPEANAPILDDSTGKPLKGADGNPVLQPETIPANEAYRLTRVHPDDFLVDEDAGPIDEDVTYKFQRIKRKLDSVKADKTYSKAFRDAVQATEVNDEDEKQREQRKKGGLLASDKDKKEPDIVVLWECYAPREKTWCLVAEGCKEFAIAPTSLPKGIENDPFVDLRFTPRDDSWYPLPPVSQWLDSQREYCDLRSKVMTHRKRFNRKYEAYTAAFDDPEQAMSQLENGEDGTVIPKNQPMQTIYPIADAPLDQQIHLENGYIRQDFMDLAVGPNQRGGTAGVDSATEAGILEKRTQIREGDKVGLVMDFLTNMARKLDQLVQAYITRDQAVLVSGPQGEQWEMVRAGDYDEIAGEYQYSIDVGSVTPQLPEIERAQWIGFIGAVIQAPWIAASKLLLKQTAQMFHISNDAMVEELSAIASQMMQQGMAQGQAGSQANLMAMNPVSAQGGMAQGVSNVRGGQQ
jgi:hypothetical protein